MTCLCKQIAGNDIELSPVCIGNLWIFQGLAPDDVQALAKEALRKKMKKGDTVFMHRRASLQGALQRCQRAWRKKAPGGDDSISADSRGSQLFDRYTQGDGYTGHESAQGNGKNYS